MQMAVVLSLQIVLQLIICVNKVVVIGGVFFTPSFIFFVDGWNECKTLCNKSIKQCYLQFDICVQMTCCAIIVGVKFIFLADCFFQTYFRQKPLRGQYHYLG